MYMYIYNIYVCVCVFVYLFLSLLSISNRLLSYSYLSIDFYSNCNILPIHTNAHIGGGIQRD